MGRYAAETIARGPTLAGDGIHRGVTPAQQDAIWSAHPLDDSFWRQASVPTGDIKVPTLRAVVGQRWSLIHRRTLRVCVSTSIAT
jgi:hypothetical protein